MLANHRALTLSRRTLLRRFGLCALGVALSPASTPARETVLAHARHPILGHWLALTPLGPAHMFFDAGGGVLIAWPHSGEGPDGYYEYTTSAVGAWQPTSVHGLDLHAVADDIDPKGTLIGTTTLESHLMVSDDGATFHGDAARDRLVRTGYDAVEAVWLGENGVPLPMSGIRMWPEASNA